MDILLNYCHFARNDPFHQCFGVKVIKNTWMKADLVLMLMLKNWDIRLIKICYRQEKLKDKDTPKATNKAIHKDIHKVTNKDMRQDQDITKSRSASPSF
ncbi:hypothetical protein L207DRAFT_584913 [Hyaloscypha variabilis F]|uniref:Uncharacterized protein n=1 Tax=Hyaloscypha variabilis (strain UAMH 11265 / GT02V1 / F) TaxID=1149755 RepID=A0A2J6RHL1_HYAVF|nr:hypothetical protein L207DRAFT_584913 [Hyaloscypha variabilis F]